MLVPDMSREDRWPRFSPRALELGAASMLSFQLYVEGDNLGALNLYSRHPNSFDDDSEQIGLLFASHAAIAFADAEKVRHLNIAVSRRDLIGQAKGILMERFKINADQAFLLLTRVSQQSNLRLYDVAEQLTETGHLDRTRGETRRAEPIWAPRQAPPPSDPQTAPRTSPGRGRLCKPP